jgi:hypothetical protein
MEELIYCEVKNTRAGCCMDSLLVTRERSAREENADKSAKGTGEAVKNS